MIAVFGGPSCLHTIQNFGLNQSSAATTVIGGYKVLHPIVLYECRNCWHIEIESKPPAIFEAREADLPTKLQAQSI